MSEYTLKYHGINVMYGKNITNTTYRYSYILTVYNKSYLNLIRC